MKKGLNIEVTSGQYEFYMTSNDGIIRSTRAKRLGYATLIT